MNSGSGGARRGGRQEDGARLHGDDEKREVWKQMKLDENVEKMELRGCCDRDGCCVMSDGELASLRAWGGWVIVPALKRRHPRPPGEGACVPV